MFCSWHTNHQSCFSQFFPQILLSLKAGPKLRKKPFFFGPIDMINTKASYNQINAKYQQMAFQSVPTNPYLESLVKQNWCKFRGLCLHSTSVVIFPNCITHYTSWLILPQLSECMVKNAKYIIEVSVALSISSRFVDAILWTFLLTPLEEVT